MLERHLAYVFVTCHNHACHPEEDDVRAGHQVGSGVVVVQLLVAGVVDAVKQRDRPEPRAEPCVEGVLVLTQVGCLQVGVATLLAGKLECFLCGLGNHELLVVVVICRDAVSPPQLARDAPVLNVLQPVLIGVLVLGRYKQNVVVHNGRQGDVGKVLHRQEPLH